MSNDPPPAATPRPADRTDILSTIPMRRIKPVEQTPWYLMSAGLVAIGMLLLPLLYLALIAGMGWVVYYHATEHTDVLNVGSAHIKLLLYLGPIVVGCTIIVFMLKPIFAPRQKQPEPVSLDPAREPVLFEYVQRIASAVGAPMPERIDIDCEPNASASFRRGMLSFFGKDLVLTIGLPLAGALTVRQLAGVLAHEFGHFTQGAGMRLTYVVNSVNHWFARVVYVRDAWDERLESAIENVGGWTSIVLLIARGGVGLSRKFLWVLMNAGHAISAALMRQMEYDADRYEARLAGSRAFRDTSDELALLSYSHSVALGRIQDLIGESRIVDDLARFSVAVHHRLPDDVRTEILEGYNSARTRKFDTHPSTADRCVNIQYEPSEGAGISEEPAALLFTDFDDLCRKATAHYVNQVFGEQYSEAEIVPLTTILEADDKEIAARNALERLLNGVVTGRMLDFSADVDVQPSGIDLKEALAASSESARTAVEQLERTGARIRALEIARALSIAGLKIPAKDLEIDRAELENVSITLQRVRDERKNLLSRLAPFERLAGRRIEAALKTDTTRVDSNLINFIDLFARLDLTDNLHDIVTSLSTIQYLFEPLQRNPQDARLIGVITNLSGTLRSLLVELHERLPEEPYPFEHGREAVAIREYVLPEIPPEEEIGLVVGAGNEAVYRVSHLRLRIAGKLAAAVEAWESQPALPRPTDGAEMEGAEV